MLLTTAGWLAAASTGTAATIDVCPDGSCDFTSVRDAVLAAADGDIIQVHPGAYVLAAGQSIEIFDVSLTIVGLGEANDVVLIGGQGAGVIDVRSTTNDDVTLRGLTIFGGLSDAGGGVYAQGANLTVENCLIDRNGADAGGGMAISGGTATIRASRFLVNDAVLYGAGLFCQNATVLIEDCLFDDNVADEGAAIASSNCVIDLVRCRFAENLHTGGGAIISSTQNSDQIPVLVDCRFCGHPSPPIVGAFVDQDGSNGFAPNCADCLLEPDLVSTWVDPTLDCNDDTFVDVCQISSGELEDRNFDEIPDVCQETLVFLVPDVFPTIAAAVAVAPSGSTIRLAAGIYNESIDFGTKDLVLEGDAKAPESVILDGTGLNDSILVLVGGQGPDTRIQGLTFRRGTRGHGVGVQPGAPGDGGAIFIDGGEPRIRDCRFVDNAAERGGAIWSDNASPRIQRCVFEGNIAMNNGGGLAVRLATDFVMSDCTLAGGQSGKFGGGIHLRNCSGTVSTTTIRTSIATDSGGGLSATGTGTLAMQSCTIESNAASGSGGGLYFDGVSVSLAGCTVCANEPSEIWGRWEDLGDNEIGCPSGPCLGDLDANGLVDGGDLGSLLVWVGTDCPAKGPCPEDLDGNGVIDGGDVGLMLAAWGPCP